MEKHINKETLIKYLNFEISYEGADFEIDNDDKMVIPDGDYFDYPTLLNGIDKFLNEEINVGDYFCWLSVALDALEVSIKNGSVIHENVLKALNDYSRDVFEPDVEHDYDWLREYTRLVRTFVKRYFKLKPNPIIDDCFNTIDVFEKHKRHSQEDINNYIGALLKLAELGDAEAYNFVGTLYYSGRFVKQNFEKARDYYLLASMHGSEQGTINLGYIYYYARCGGSPNYDAAYDQFYKAFWIGDDSVRVEAGYKIFDLYFNGYGVKKDLERAKDILDSVYQACKNVKKEEGHCDFFGDVYMRFARLYSDKGIKNDPNLRLKYLLKAKKEIEARWDGVWFGDKKLLEECAEGIEQCKIDIVKMSN